MSAMKSKNPKPVFYNKPIDKGALKKLIATTYSEYGAARCAYMCDFLKTMGFHYATQAAVSISIEDLKVPPVKKALLAAAERTIKETTERYVNGEITEVERFQKVIDTWNDTSETLKDEVVRHFQETDPLNSVYMMAFSGARGNISQVRQLVGMRGLMADPQGEIIDLPIKTNFREGLTVTEYIISSYGARKGLVDTALRTADSGYLTRRLVDVAQDVIVREVDCGTTRGIYLTAIKDGERVLLPLADRLFGRVLAEDIFDPNTGELIAARNTVMDEKLAKRIASITDRVLVRSPLTCESSRSVCQKCYGWSLAHCEWVNLGEAIGIIAAQSIGEPGTQLTMRTFHTGGVFTGEVARRITSPVAGEVKFPRRVKLRETRTRHGEQKMQLETACEITVGGEKVSLPAGSLLAVKPGDIVKENDLLAEVMPPKSRSTEKATKDVVSDLSGEILFDNISPESKTDKQGNTTTTATRNGLIWIVSGQVYNLPPGAEPAVRNGQKVKRGDVLAQTLFKTKSGGVCRGVASWQQDGEIEVVTASVTLDQADVYLEQHGNQQQYVIHTQRGDRFALKVLQGTKVYNNQVVAELIDDTYVTETGGIIRYAGLETGRGNKKQGYEVLKEGTILWIPEECHEVNKDISLLLVEDGQYVEAGTEIVKDIYCQSSGVVEVIQKNDILREVIIKPGKLYLDLDPDYVAHIEEDSILPPGTQISADVVTEEEYFAQFVDTPEGVGLLLRPIKQYHIVNRTKSPSQESFNAQGASINLRPVLKIFYKDGERVKSVDGVQLVSTQLVLEASEGMSADIELIPQEDKENCYRLQIVVLESIILRRELESEPNITTRVLVKDGQQVPPGATIGITELLCQEDGIVQGVREGQESIRRILVVRSGDLYTLETEEKPTCKEGQFLKKGDLVANAVTTPEPGRVIKVDGNKIVIRRARPYRVSAGGILHVVQGQLVQRGEVLASLVFERAKTGDIVQGLPRIEELLEARKPKEPAIIARRGGICKIEYRDEDPICIKVVEDDGAIAEYPLTQTQNVIVTENQRVEVGQALTDGIPNPHELLDVYFSYYLEQENMSMYEATLAAWEKVQMFIVNQVQSVYLSQGIEIADKHIEVIVRQMTTKVRVDDGGDTTRLPGELVELRQVEKDNENIALIGGAPIQYTPIVMGITKASLNTDSFISAASFQETTRVLTEAAIEGKSDWLRGLKENVIIGRLIPAGTGFNAYLRPDSDTNDKGRDRPHHNNGVTRPNGALVGGNPPESSPSPPTPVDDVLIDDQTARQFASEEEI